MNYNAVNALRDVSPAAVRIRLSCRQTRSGRRCHRYPDLPLPVCWRSPPTVTHGEVLAALPVPDTALPVPISSFCGGVRLPWPLRPDTGTHRVKSWDLSALAYRSGPRPARRGPGGHRAVPALAAGRAPLPALYGLAAAVSRGRLLPVQHRRPERGTRPPCPAGTRQGQRGGARPAATGGG